MIRFLQTPDPLKKIILSALLLIICGGMVITLIPGGLGSDLLGQNNLTVATFEQDVKNEILERKLATLITGSASVSDSDVRKEFEKRNTKVKFEYAFLSQDDIRKALHPTDEELKAFYTRNQARYKDSIPEKRKIEYAFLDKSKVLAQTQVTPEELQAYYNQHREEFRVQEEVKVSHILVKTPPAGPDGKVDEKGVEEARKKAEDVLKQLKGGAKFEDLAKKYSDDPGSAKQGGELGWIGRGRTVPEFEKAAFSQAKGQPSDPVKSSYGFHIIRTEDKHEAHLKTLDEVKDQIEPLIRQQKTTRALDAAGNALLDQARTQGLEKAAAAKGVNPVTTDFVGRTDASPGVGSSPQLMDAVFSEREKAAPDMAQLGHGVVEF